MIYIIYDIYIYDIYIINIYHSKLRNDFTSLSSTGTNQKSYCLYKIPDNCQIIVLRFKLIAINHGSFPLVLVR